MSDVSLPTPLEALAEAARAALGDKIIDSRSAFGELTLTTHRYTIIAVMEWLKADGFVSIVDVCGVDYPERAERFEVVYHLLNPKKNTRVRVKLSTDDTE